MCLKSAPPQRGGASTHLTEDCPQHQVYTPILQAENMEERDSTGDWTRPACCLFTPTYVWSLIRRGKCWRTGMIAWGSNPITMRREHCHDVTCPGRVSDVILNWEGNENHMQLVLLWSKWRLTNPLCILQHICSSLRRPSGWVAAMSTNTSIAVSAGTGVSWHSLPLSSCLVVRMVWRVSSTGPKFSYVKFLESFGNHWQLNDSVIIILYFFNYYSSFTQVFLLDSPIESMYPSNQLWV